MAIAASACTWLVAACMSRTALCVAEEKKRPTGQGLGRLARRKKLSSLMNSCSCGSSLGQLGPETFSSSSFLNQVFKGSQDYYQYSKAGPLSGHRGLPLLSVAEERDVFGHGKKRSNRIVAGTVAARMRQSTDKVATEKNKEAKQRRVVVTGMGVVTSLGHDPDTFYKNLLEGVSGISEIESFDCSGFSTRIAGEIKSFSPDGWVSPKISKRMDKFMLYMLTAGKKALIDGGLTEETMKNLDAAKCGVLIGSGIGGVQGWMGPNYSISTACATSNFCMLNAANHIMQGEADVMLAGGSEGAVLPIGIGGFLACRALSRRNDEPEKASRPWDSNRDGFVIGEGAGVLLLEELGHAKQRGAHIYAEFLGGAFTCDAYSLTEPHPEGRGIILCMEKALTVTGVARENVNYINAHGASTQVGDMREFKAMIKCFGQNPQPELRINSTKSMIGHLLGAAGGVEAVATIQAIRSGWVHPNINLENPDKNMDAKLLVGTKKERLDIKVAMSNSFGFGGHSSSILFAPYKEIK